MKPSFHKLKQIELGEEVDCWSQVCGIAIVWIIRVNHKKR